MSIHFQVYAPELMLMDLDPGNPVSSQFLRGWAIAHSFSVMEVEEFIAMSKPGDFLTCKDITIIRLGRNFTES